MKMITFILGIFVGSAIGIFTMALVKVESLYDEEE